MTQELKPIKGQGWLLALGLAMIAIGIGLLLSTGEEDADRQVGRVSLSPATTSLPSGPKRIEVKNNFFDTISGKPKVWYYIDEDGLYEFYDKPGYHPATGKVLQPITRQVLSEWEAFKGQQAEIIKQRDRKRLLVELRSMIDISNLSKHTSNVALAVVSDAVGNVFPQLSEKMLLNHLKSNVVRYNMVSDFFKEDFGRKGYFVKVFNGDIKLLRDTQALSYVDYVFLGKIKYTFASGVVEGIVSCNIDFEYKIFNKEGSIVDRGTVNAVGPGYTEEGAFKRGLERLMEEDGNRILKKFL